MNRHSLIHRPIFLRGMRKCGNSIFGNKNAAVTTPGRVHCRNKSVLTPQRRADESGVIGWLLSDVAINHSSAGRSGRIHRAVQTTPAQENIRQIKNI